MKKILLFAGLFLAAISARAQDSRGVPSTSVQATEKQVMRWDNTGGTWGPAALDSALISQKAISLGDINVTGWTAGHYLSVGTGGVVYPVAPSAAAYNTAFAINGSNLRITDGGGNLDVSVISIAPVQSVVAGTGAVTVTSATGTFTVNNTDPDQLLTNEGSLTVGAGGASTSLISSNTSGSTDVTITAGTGLTTAEAGNVITLTNSAPDQTVVLTGAGINAVTGTYPSFTITGTEVDGLLTNEGSLTVAAGTATTSVINSNTSGQTGVTLTAGNGITISEAGNVITLTQSNDGLTTVTGSTSSQANEMTKK
jgi:hypothetical protein